MSIEWYMQNKKATEYYNIIKINRHSISISKEYLKKYFHYVLEDELYAMLGYDPKEHKIYIKFNNEKEGKRIHESKTSYINIPCNAFLNKWKISNDNIINEYGYDLQKTAFYSE